MQETEFFHLRNSKTKNGVYKQKRNNVSVNTMAGARKTEWVRKDDDMVLILPFGHHETRACQCETPTAVAAAKSIRNI